MWHNKRVKFFRVLHIRPVYDRSDAGEEDQVQRRAKGVGAKDQKRGSACANRQRTVDHDRHELRNGRARKVLLKERRQPACRHLR